jgi:hypothetical protein
MNPARESRHKNNSGVVAFRVIPYRCRSSEKGVSGFAFQAAELRQHCLRSMSF